MCHPNQNLQQSTEEQSDQGQIQWRRGVNQEYWWRR
jgi:hypothetical protein